MYPIAKMKKHDTNGSEYCVSEEEKIKLIKSETSIAKINCEYCNAEILAVWDKDNKDNWWPYLGSQARKQNIYKYSSIIQTMRKYDELESGKVWNNSLLNVHARCHSKNWSLRLHKNSIKLLCNECFQKTYNRIQILTENDEICAISVIHSLGETIESVMKDLELNNCKILGKGGGY